EDLRYSQPRKRLPPDLQGPGAALFHKDHLPVVKAQAEHVTIIAEVHEHITRTLLGFASEVVQQAEAVNMVLERLAISLVVTSLQFLDDVLLTHHGEKRRQPIMVLHDPIGDRTRFDLPWPAYDHRYSKCPFPVGVLLAAKRCHGSIGPR